MTGRLYYVGGMNMNTMTLAISETWATDLLILLLCLIVGTLAVRSMTKRDRGKVRIYDWAQDEDMVDG